MAEKRDIDRKRDGAVTIELCDLEDKTPIRLGFSDSKNLYTITDKGIYVIKLADDIARSLRFLRNLRNGDEHPNEKERTVILDFSLMSEGNFYPPTIELIHPHTPQEKIPISAFMEQGNSNLIDIFEGVIFQVCQNNMGNFGNFECEIMEMPPERRRHRDTRFGYVMQLNGQWTPLG